MLPLIREASLKKVITHFFVITPSQVMFFSKNIRDTLPDACFEVGKEAELAEYAKERHPIILPFDQIEGVSMSQSDSYELGNADKDGYRFQFNVEGKILIDCRMPPEEAQFVIYAINHLARLHHWNLQIDQPFNTPLSRFTHFLLKSNRILRRITLYCYATFLCNSLMIGMGCVIASENPALFILGWSLILISLALGSALIFRLRTVGKTVTRNLAGKDPFRSTILYWALKAVALALLLFYVNLELPEYLNQNNILSITAGGLYLGSVAWILHCAHRLAVKPLAKEQITSEGTRHCLYLRSFNRDLSGSFNKEGWRSSLFGLSPNRSINEGVTFFKMLYLANPLTTLRLLFFIPRESAEEQLMAYLTRIMPVRAIGKPGDSTGVLGAQRSYVSDDQWQNAVQASLKTASLVLLQPGTSKHMFWEIEQSLNLCSWNRLVFWLSGMEGRQALYDRLRIYLERRTGMQIPRALGKHHFLALNGSYPRMLPLIDSNAFRWPLCGCSVSFERTLAPALNSLQGNPVATEDFKRGWVRRLNTFAAFIFWSVIQYFYIVLLVIFSAFSVDLWSIHQLREAAAQRDQKVQAILPAPLLSAELQVPNGWKQTDAFRETGADGTENFNLRAWAWDRSACVLFRTVSSSANSAHLYEQDPISGAVAGLKSADGSNGFTLGPVETVFRNGRWWAQAEFSSPYFANTWHPGHRLTSLFGPQSRGIAGVTYGPEGVLVVYAFCPASFYSLERTPLLQILDGVQFSGKGEKSVVVQKDIGRVIGQLRDSVDSTRVSHERRDLLDMKLMLPKEWNPISDNRFQYDNFSSVDLTWSVRPREISDETSRKAAERSLRRFEATEHSRYETIRCSNEEVNGVTIEAESRMRWLLQRSYVTPSGVIALQARCPKVEREAWKPVLEASLQGLHYKEQIAREQQSLIQLQSNSDNSRKIDGVKAAYTLQAPAIWRETREHNVFDRVLQSPEAGDANFLVLVEELENNLVQIDNLPGDKVQAIIYEMSKNIANESEETSCILQEATLLSAPAGELQFRFRVIVQSQEGLEQQRTYFVYIRGSVNVSFICVTTLKSTHAHDALFAPLIKSITWRP